MTPLLPMQKFFRGTCFPGNALFPTAFLIEGQASLCSSMPSVRLRSSFPSPQRSPNPSQSVSIRAFFAGANSNSHRGSPGLSCGDGRRRLLSIKASKKYENCEEVEGGDTEKKAKVELLSIPGIGPRNLRKLADKGFQGVAQLKQLYKDKVMTSFLSMFS